MSRKLLSVVMILYQFKLQEEEAIQAVTGILADLLYFPMESDLEMRTLISTGQTPRPLLEYDAKIKVS